MGQILSSPFIIIGIVCMVRAKDGRRKMEDGRWKKEDGITMNYEL
jgi:prolipoprotein diacylglyceryltransferase